jgi:chaperonin GroEL
MNPKRIYTEEEGQRLLRQGVKEFAYAVKSTLGPAGRTVLVEDDKIIGGFGATKDGYTVAKSIRFADPVMDKAALMLNQAAAKTAAEAGDATTTSIVLSEAILDAYDKYAPESGLSPIEISRGIQSVCAEIIKQLDNNSIPAVGDMLLHVATISANNDPVIGKIISDVFEQTDVVLVERSPTGEMYSEVVEGLKLDVGFSRPAFINNPSKMECILENPYIFVCDSEINSFNSMADVLKDIFEKNESILFITKASEKAMAMVMSNVVKFGMNACVVHPVSYGIDRKEKMSDLAHVIGARHFSDDTGDDLQLIKKSDFGRASRVIVSRDRTIIQINDESKVRVSERVSELKIAEKTIGDDKAIQGRIEAISGSCGIIYVGAATEIEAGELRDRIDDAVCAVRAAKEEGILPGGGVGLVESFTETDVKTASDVSYKIMCDVVFSPIEQMIKNSGVKFSQNVHLSNKDGVGFNIKTGEFCNMVEAGVIDPTKAVKSALKNAVSVATTIINTAAVVTTIRDHE